MRTEGAVVSLSSSSVPVMRTESAVTWLSLRQLRLSSALSMATAGMPLSRRMSRLSVPAVPIEASGLASSCVVFWLLWISLLPARREEGRAIAAVARPMRRIFSCIFLYFGVMVLAGCLWME
ncbi:hypothetical protein N657DRAFT_370945 [Parathielavia appendiculata]|uniref:Uncharacterized protein n=1 Tax=Parathielavia appendiculata TaxID=2587402 RepID=A0AAN6TR00_9PEZI|nr:hypothetical protein N657DRAFT_370945 [Parathielavia appendiculata]